MTSRIPRISAGRLSDPNRPTEDIQVDTPAWFAWLEAATSISFAYPIVEPGSNVLVGFMTVRKERKQRRYQYWSAYRRRNGRLRKRYLGPSRQVTLAQLEAIAEGFRHEGAPQRAAADVARKEEETVQWQEQPPVPQEVRTEGHALVLDVTSEEPRNMDNVVRSHHTNPRPSLRSAA